MPAIPEFSPAAPSGQGFQQSQNLMMRAAESRLRQEQAVQQLEQKRIEFEIARPVMAATAQATAAEMQTKYDIAINTQNTRARAFELYKDASDDFDFLNLVTDDRVRANLSRQWLSKYAQLANVAELKNEMEVKTHLAVGNIQDMLKINMLKTAEVRSFEALTQGMGEDEIAAAKRVKTGLQARPSSAAITYREVVQPDGRTILVAVDPRSVGAHVIGSGQQYGSGVSQVESPGVVTQPSPDGQVQVQNPFVSQTPGEKQGQQTAAKEKAEYEQQLVKDKPKRKAALQVAETSANRLSTEIDDLISKVSAATAGPGGVILNKFPGTTAKDFESNLTALKSVIGFQALQAMRDASPTGGALGQVSDFENKLLQAQLGSLEVGQSPTQLIENLKKVKQRVTENFGIARAAYTNQFGEGHTDALPDLKSMSTEQLEKRLRELRGQP